MSRGTDLYLVSDCARAGAFMRPNTASGEAVTSQPTTTYGTKVCICGMSVYVLSLCLFSLPQLGTQSRTPGTLLLNR